MDVVFAVKFAVSVRVLQKTADFCWWHCLRRRAILTIQFLFIYGFY
jgi:hypothetical protein